MIADWIATAGTAIVGMAGIAATYLSGRRALIAQSRNMELQIGAERERTRLADKRRIYAAFIAATSRYVAAAQSLAVARVKNAAGSRVTVLRSELDQAMTAMLSILGEIRLIAPEKLVIFSLEVVQKVTTTADLTDTFPELRDVLYELMRADLGEPPQPRISVPELVAQALDR
jgi:hypothetical protein